MFYIGERGFVCQIIEPVTFASCAFIIALQNIALRGYLDTRRNINFRIFTARRSHTYQPPRKTSLDMGPIFPWILGGIPGYDPMVMAT